MTASIRSKSPGSTPPVTLSKKGSGRGVPSARTIAAPPSEPSASTVTRRVNTVIRPSRVRISPKSAGSTSAPASTLATPTGRPPHGS